jgi:hypothetical protein
MFAAIDDVVTLPSFARVDAAAYYLVSRRLRCRPTWRVCSTRPTSRMTGDAISA